MSQAIPQVVVDATRCQTYGLCLTIHPEIFDLPSDGTVARVLRDVEADDLPDVEEAIRACPAQAILLRQRDN